ncbi:MAG: type II toxin-antitoxin system HipA family toxin [Halopseudomonas sabulinigri]
MRWLTVAHDLSVWLQGERVGALSLVEGRMSFQYSTSALDNPSIPALSISLPKRVSPFSDSEARPFFAGLLPEGAQRARLEKITHVSRQNEFGMLRALGGECAGAVTITLDDRAPTQGQSAQVQWLSDEELGQVIRELPRRPMLAGTDGLRLSLAGAQDKLPVVFDGHRVGLPLNGSPSTHIMKPAIRTLDGSVINEAFSLKLAGAMGLQVAESLVLNAAGEQTLLVERYDRIHEKLGAIHRVHQEDFCQALGVVSEAKYQSEGGPGFSDAFDLLRKATRPSVMNVLNLFDYAVFNVLVGNHDAHGKNYSLLYSDKGPVLAPLYDVLSTTIYPELTNKMAMKIGGKYKFTEIMDRHWDRFADDCGLSKSHSRKRIKELANALPETARKLAGQHEAFAESDVVAKILDVVDHRSALTLERLPSNAQRLVAGLNKINRDTSETKPKPKGPNLR